MPPTSRCRSRCPPASPSPPPPPSLDPHACRAFSVAARHRAAVLQPMVHPHTVFTAGAPANLGARRLVCGRATRCARDDCARKCVPLPEPPPRTHWCRYIPLSVALGNWTLPAGDSLVWGLAPCVWAPPRLPTRLPTSITDRAHSVCRSVRCGSAAHCLLRVAAAPPAPPPCRRALPAMSCWGAVSWRWRLSARDIPPRSIYSASTARPLGLSRSTARPATGCSTALAGGPIPTHSPPGRRCRRQGRRQPAAKAGRCSWRRLPRLSRHRFFPPRLRPCPHRPPCRLPCKRHRRFSRRRRSLRHHLQPRHQLLSPCRRCRHPLSRPPPPCQRCTQGLY